MTVPVNVIPASGVLSRPYVTAGMFRGFPTWLDLDNLIPGGASALQDDELGDVLLQASDWAVGVCENMLLHAHWVQGENQRARSKSSGRIYVRPRDIPLRGVTALSWGGDPSFMNTVTLPDSSMWIEDGRRVSWTPGGGVTQFRGPALQFGPSARPPSQVYVTWSYVAGYPSTYLAAPVAAGATSAEVADPTGMLPGDTLRIYDLGVSEALTVASTYTPAMPTVPPTVTAIPLAAGTANAHAQGTGVTEMPRKMLQAIIAYAVALMMREDVTDEEPVTGFGPAARTTSGGRGGQAAGLVNDAYGWLFYYAPTLRS